MVFLVLLDYLLRIFKFHKDRVSCFFPIRYPDGLNGDLHVVDVQHGLLSE